MMALLQVRLAETMSTTRHDGPRPTWAQTAAEMGRNRGPRIYYVLVSRCMTILSLAHASSWIWPPFERAHLSASDTTIQKVTLDLNTLR